MQPEAGLASPAGPDRETGRRRAAKLSELARRWFSFPALMAAGLVVIAFCTVSTRFSDPDVWWHLKVGQTIAATHSIPTSDTFSYTVYGHPWTAHEWLAQLSIYAAYAAGGYRGLMLWLSVLTSVLLVLVFLRCWIETRNSMASFVGAMLAWFFATIGM